MTRNNASGRFFVTPSAVDKWRRWFPHHSEEDALARLIDLSEEAKAKGEADNGLMRFRCERPLRIYLLVAPPERGRTLPAIVDLAPPHEGWRPPGQHGGRRPGAGKPSQGGPNPEYRKRLPPDVYAWIEAQAPDYIERLVRADMAKR